MHMPRTFDEIKQRTIVPVTETIGKRLCRGGWLRVGNYVSTGRRAYGYHPSLPDVVEMWLTMFVRSIGGDGTERLMYLSIAFAAVYGRAAVGARGPVQRIAMRAQAEAEDGEPMGTFETEYGIGDITRENLERTLTTALHLGEVETQ
jgi:hypothetical protein